MNLIEIIDKDNRTPEEYKFAYKILYKADKTITNMIRFKDILNFDRILNGLRLVSKSRILLCKWCPFKFKMSYICKCKQTTQLPIMRYGSNMHLANEIFWKRKIKFKDLIQTKKIYKTIYDRYLPIIPKDEQNDKFIQEMVHAFSTFETNRIKGIFDEIGQTKEAIQNYVFPVCNEISIENWNLRVMGIIDRVDRMTNECLAAVEYKYGKPKYFHASVYHESMIKKELGFYGILPQGKDVFAIVGTGDAPEAIPIKEYLGFEPRFYYGSMLFFQDIEKTALIFKLNIHILNGALKSVKNYWERLSKGYFPPKPMNSCTEHCDYLWDVCELNPQWQAIENCMVGT